MQNSMKTALPGDNRPAQTQTAEKRFHRMKIWPYAAATWLACMTTAAVADDPRPTAIFPIGFDDTSLQGQEQGPRDDEQKRLSALDTQLHNAIAGSGCCASIDMTLAAKTDPGTGQPSCDGCELAVARRFHAEIAITGWVQKVSNLILNINIVARDVSTGNVISAGSVDIRGNTDESWSRGLAYLLRNRLHPSDW